eukprot:2288775-Pyramimonas_sp.AAC.1
MDTIDKKLVLERMLASNNLEHGTTNLCLRDGLQLLHHSKMMETSTAAYYATMGCENKTCHY